MQEEVEQRIVSLMMAVDGFASYNLHLLQSDPDRRPRNPNPLSHLQNFFIVRVRH